MPEDRPYDFRDPKDISFVLDKLTELFSVEPHYESGQQAETISRALANEQPALYNQIYRVVSDNLPGRNEWDQISRGAGVVGEALNRSLSFSPDRVDSGWIVRGSIPVITTETVRQFQTFFGRESRMKGASPQTQIEFAALYFATIIRRSTDFRPILFQINSAGHFYGELISACARYDRHLVQSEIPEQATKKLNAIAIKQEELSSYTEGLQKRTLNIAKAIESASEQIIAIRQRIDNQNISIDNIKNEATAHQAALREELKLGETKKLWEQRATQSTLAFAISSVIIVILISVITVSLVYYSDEVINFVRNVEEKSYPDAIPLGDSGALSIALSVAFLSRIALVAIPAALVIWILRILVRFQTRSMLLMDDARQRVSILNTYLFLTEQGVVDKSDRAAVLEALFRRAPGHGPDSVDPPDFVDLIKLNSGKGE